MNIENELTILKVNKKEFIDKIKSLGAIEMTPELKQIRCVYDFNPVNPNKWIRLRTNGIKTTLTIKEINGNSKLGAKELEIEVSNFEITNQILNELGYTPRNIQENLRHIFKLNDAEISIDTWPMIDPYVEIEAKNKEEINDIIMKLNIPNSQITELDVSSIYKEIYNIDVLKIKDLKF